MKRTSTTSPFIHFLFLLTLGFGNLHSQDLPKAQILKNGVIYPYNAQTLNSLEGYVENPVNMELSKYGGWKAHRTTATGFFRAERIDGRWWAIDPEGYYYVHKAPNSIHLDDLTADEVYQWLKEHGFNGMGNWSDNEITESSLNEDTPMGYCPKLSFMGAYTTEVGSDIKMPVFNEDFQEVADELARKAFSPFVNDPQVFGYFSDNELPWRDQGLPAHIALTDHSDINYITANNFLAERGKNADNWDMEDQYAYIGLMGERYYSVISSAIKKVDPNHMYIGSRCNSTEKEVESFMTNQGKYVDIVTVNHYGRWGNRQVETQRMSEWANKPLMTTEFYGQVDDPNVNETGAGFLVVDELSRGLFYQNFVSTMAQSGYVVGMHWFAFQDKGTSHKSFVDPNGNNWPELANHAKELNDRLYDFIDYSDSRPKPNFELLPEADAFFQGGTNHGDNEELWAKEGNREIYIRFDLSTVDTDVASAKIKLFSVAQRSETGRYQAELVVDDTWDEMGIKNSNNPSGSTILATWGDGSDQVIDVTQQVLDALQDNKKLSIRIISTFNNGSIPRYGSKENSNPVAHPKLCITSADVLCENAITPPSFITPGINYSYFEGEWNDLPNFDNLTAIQTGLANEINLDPATGSGPFALLFNGYIDIPTNGAYTFYTTSDDGSRLLIDGTEVVSNDGVHSATEKSGEICLDEGYHKITIEYFEKAGDSELFVMYEAEGISKRKLENLYGLGTCGNTAISLPDSIVPGANYSHYEGTWNSLPDFGLLTPIHSGVTPEINVTPSSSEDNFGLVFDAYTYISMDGDYTFYTTSDDGSRLLIDGIEVVDNDGSHGVKEESGSLCLATGYHQIKVEYFDKSGDHTLSTEYEGPNFSKKTIIDLFAAADNPLVTNINSLESNNKGINIYPNPVNNVLKVNLELSNTAKLDVINYLGATVLSSPIDNDNLSIDVSDLPMGIYIVRVTQGNFVKTQKINKIN